MLLSPHLSHPPDPTEMRDKFSAVMGDVFHAMDRTKIPLSDLSDGPSADYESGRRPTRSVWPWTGDSSSAVHFGSAPAQDERILPLRRAPLCVRPPTASKEQRSLASLAMGNYQ